MRVVGGFSWEEPDWFESAFGAAAVHGDKRVEGGIPFRRVLFKEASRP